MRALTLLLILFTACLVSASPNCGVDLSSPDAIAQLKSLKIRSVYDASRRPGPELRAVIGQLYPELGARTHLIRSPELEQRLRLEDKTAILRAGVTALVFDETAVALVKWEPHPLYGTPVYLAVPAGYHLIRELHALRVAFNGSLGLSDPWAIPTAARGLEFLHDDMLRLNPESPDGVSTSGLSKFMDIKFVQDHGEFARLRISQSEDGSWILSVHRNDQDRGARKLFTLAKNELVQVAAFAQVQVRAIIASPLFNQQTRVFVRPGGRRQMWQLENTPAGLAPELDALVRSTLGVPPGTSAEADLDGVR